MSLVMEATAQSPERRANSSASAMRNGRRRSRSVSSLTMPQGGRSASMPRRLAGAPPSLVRAGLGLDGDICAPIAFGRELDAPIRQREQGVVRTHADISAGMPFGATLSRQDITRQDMLATVLLDAEPAAR